MPRGSVFFSASLPRFGIGTFTSPYDYLGVLRFALPFLRRPKDKWFCSELVAAALRDLAGWSVDPAKARPSTVYFHLGGKG